MDLGNIIIFVLHATRSTQPVKMCMGGGGVGGGGFSPRVGFFTYMACTSCLIFMSVHRRKINANLKYMML